MNDRLNCEPCHSFCVLDGNPVKQRAGAERYRMLLRGSILEIHSFHPYSFHEGIFLTVPSAHLGNEDMLVTLMKFLP